MRQTVPIGAAQDVAIDNERGKYYVTVSDRSELTIVDRQTLKVVDSVPLPGAPDVCAYDSKNGLVYVDRGNGEDVWVVDPSARRIVATIKVPKSPEFILYDPASDRIYQNIKSKPVTLSIDPAMNSVIETWSTEPAESLHGLAVNPETHRLFSAGGNGKLSVLDSASGNVLSSAEIASGVDQIAFDPANNRVYCASGRSGLSVVEETADGVRLIGKIATPAGAHTLAVDPATHAVWIAYAKENQSFLCKLSCSAVSRPVPESISLTRNRTRLPSSKAPCTLPQTPNAADDLDIRPALASSQTGGSVQPGNFDRRPRDGCAPSCRRGSS